MASSRSIAKVRPTPYVYYPLRQPCSTNGRRRVRIVQCSFVSMIGREEQQQPMLIWLACSCSSWPITYSYSELHRVRPAPHSQFSATASMHS